MLLGPFVRLSLLLTRSLAEGPTLRGVNRQELIAMAELGEREGTLENKESAIVRNLMRLGEIIVREVMTPRTVVFSIPEDLSVEDYFRGHGDQRFSRIPIS